MNITSIRQATASEASIITMIFRGAEGDAEALFLMPPRRPTKTSGGQHTNRPDISITRINCHRPIMIIILSMPS